MKSHCCCCVRLSDGVILVGIYGASFHAGLLVLQVTHGHTLTPSSEVDPFADAVVQPVVLAVHSAGVVVNALLVFGAHFHRRLLMLPWLFSQGILALVLTSLALYYLLLFPASECYPTSDVDPINRVWQFPEECHVLLWHAVIMILSILVLFYYFYVVLEFVAQLRAEARAKVAGVEMTIEPKEVEVERSEEEGAKRQEREKKRVRIQEPP